MDTKKTEGWKPPALKGRALAQQLPVTDHQALIADHLEHAKGHAKHSARSAVFHLGRAWTIRSADPEMATFRCVTAEEEAATAVFRSLKQRQYPGAKRLQLHSHPHKNAFPVFFGLVSRALHEFGVEELEPTVYFDKEDHSAQPQLALKLVLDGVPHSARPDPPLGLRILVNGKEHSFEDQIAALESRIDSGSLKIAIEDRANQRNKLLYAWQDGVPSVDPTNIEEVIAFYQLAVFRYLTFFLLADRYPQKQLFVAQLLEAFLSLLDRLQKKPGKKSG